jgi:hypothetical protein
VHEADQRANTETPFLGKAVIDLISDSLPGTLFGHNRFHIPIRPHLVDNEWLMTRLNDLNVVV